MWMETVTGVWVLVNAPASYFVSITKKGKRWYGEMWENGRLAYSNGHPDLEHLKARLASRF